MTRVQLGLPTEDGGLDCLSSLIPGHAKCRDNEGQARPGPCRMFTATTSVAWHSKDDRPTVRRQLASLSSSKVQTSPTLSCAFAVFPRSARHFTQRDMSICPTQQNVSLLMKGAIQSRTAGNGLDRASYFSSALQSDTGLTLFPAVRPRLSKSVVRVLAKCCSLSVPACSAAAS